jgi:large subunit ribosomal protein L10
MPTPQKAAAIDELAESLEKAQLAVLTDYRGLRVGDLQALRASLRPLGAEIHIAKNTLTRIAAERVGIDGLAPMLEGPLALVFAYNDPVGTSKAITDFARTSRILTVKAGVLSNKVIQAGDVESLASMPSREVLLARLLGLLLSPMARAAGVLSGPSRSIAYLAQARAEQLAGAA